MASHYFDRVQSNGALAKEKPKPFSSSFAEHWGPASDWQTRHLASARVVIKAGARFPLQDCVDKIKTNGLVEQSRGAASFLAGPPQDYRAKSEKALLEADTSPGSLSGHVWAALGDLTNALDPASYDHAANVDRPRRAKKQTGQPNTVPSATMQIASSSPVAPSSQVDPEQESYTQQHGNSAEADESMTVRLIGAVLRLACCCCPGFLAAAVPEFRHQQMSLSVTLPATGRRLTARDDGGIRIRMENEEGRYVPCHGVDNLLAILEAKKAFAKIDDGRPVMTDEWLAQMTCEALAARIYAKTHPEHPKNHD